MHLTTAQACKLLIVDEAHHAIGNHPYVQIIEKAKEPRLVGLTACFLHGKFRTPHEKKAKLQKHFCGKFWMAEEEDITDYLPEFYYESVYFSKAADTNFEDERQRLGDCLDTLTKMDGLPKNRSKHLKVRGLGKNAACQAVVYRLHRRIIVIVLLAHGDKVVGKLGLLLGDNTFKIRVFQGWRSSLDHQLSHVFT